MTKILLALLTSAFLVGPVYASDVKKDGNEAKGSAQKESNEFSDGYY